MRRIVPALFSLVFLPIAAHADTFNISVTANGSTYAGSVSGDSQGNGSFLITSVSPNFAGFPGAVSVVAPASSIFGADDLFFPNDTRLFDINGLEITGSFGVANLFLFNGGPGFSIQGYDPTGAYYNLPASVTLASSAATPEPSSVMLSFTGLLAVAALGFRKRFAAAAFSNIA